VNNFLPGFLCAVVLMVFASIFLPKQCNADYGATIYSSYYSSAHMAAVFGDYYSDYDIEFGGFLTSNDAANKSGVTSYMVQANLKTPLNKTTSFLYGISAEIFTDGESKGVKFTGTSYGPYVGLERSLDDNLRLRAIYHPVYFSSFEVAGVKTTTTDFGLNGAFGLTYIF